MDLSLQVCHAYRREGWELLLAQSLQALRDVAARLRLPSEHAIYTLELAALSMQLQADVSASSSSSSSRRPVGQQQLPPAEALADAAQGLRRLGLGAEDGPFGRLSYGQTAEASQHSSTLGSVLDPAAALSACRAAIQVLMSGISDIKQGIMKHARPNAAAVAGGGELGPEASTSSIDSVAVTSTPVASPGQASIAAAAGATGGSVNGSSGSGGVARHFHYSMEWLDTKAAQKRAREAGDEQATMANLMHKHSQQVGGGKTASPGIVWIWLLHEIARPIIA